MAKKNLFFFFLGVCTIEDVVKITHQLVSEGPYTREIYGLPHLLMLQADIGMFHLHSSGKLESQL